MTNQDSGFSTLELLVVISILGVVAALALPGTNNALKSYRLHSDASAVVSYLNVTRMRAASQYAPYAFDVDPSPIPPTYVIEKLSSTPYNPLSPSSTGSYASLSPPVYEQGTQYASIGTSFSACRPTGVSAYPGSVTADPGSCTGPFQFCFNTRGLPVLCTTTGGNPPGSPLTNGGATLYLTGQNGMIDAVTIAVGGGVQLWNWSPGAAKWYLR
jgi:prepilin-type N-terminal cleavage/methylation domain-containing protein